MKQYSAERYCRRRRLACLMIAVSVLLFGRDLRAQDAVVAGVVRDSVSGDPLVHANVAIQGTQRGTATNEAGEFTLRGLKPDRSYILVCSYVGYRTYRDSFRLAAGAKQKRIIRLRRQRVNLSEVVVDTRQSNRPAEHPQAVRMTPRTVNQMPTALTPDVFRALQKLPGISASSDYSSDLYIRGSDPGQTLVQLDGAPIYNPSHLLGFFSTFNPSAVSRVRLFKGSYPVEYGGRLGSVVRVETDRPRDQVLGGNLDVGLLDSRSMLEGSLPGGTWMIAARRSNMEPVLAELNDRKVDGVPESFRFYDLNANFDLELSSSDRLSMTLFRSGDDMYFPFNQNLVFDVNHGNTAGVIGWRHMGGDSWLTRLSASASRYFSDSDALLTRAPFSRSTEIIDASVKGHVEYFFGNAHNITTGFQLGLQRFDVHDTHGGITTLNRSMEPRYGAAYLAGSFDLSPLWTIQGGVRSEYFESGDHLRFSPRLRLEYRPFGTIRFHLSGGRYHQFMTRSSSQLISSFDTWLPVNRHLRPAAGEHLSGGIEWAPLDKLAISVDGYARRMDGLFRLDPRRSDGTGVSYHELFLKGDGFSYGAEVLLESTADWLTGTAGYTYGLTARRYPTLNGGEFFAPRHDRRHAVNLAAFINLSDGWRTSVTFKYATGQPYTRPSTQYQLVDSPYMGHNHYVLRSELNGTRLPPYQRLDLGVTRRGTAVGSLSYEIQMQIVNVLSSNNVWFDLYQPDNGAAIERTRILQIPIPLPNLSLGLQF